MFSIQCIRKELKFLLDWVLFCLQCEKRDNFHTETNSLKIRVPFVRHQNQNDADHTMFVAVPFTYLYFTKATPDISKAKNVTKHRQKTHYHHEQPLRFLIFATLNVVSCTTDIGKTEPDRHSNQSTMNKGERKRVGRKKRRKERIRPEK